MEHNNIYKEKIITLNQIILGLIHEINQPLQSIKLLSDSIVFWDNEGKKLEYNDILNSIKKISERIDYLNKLIKNMQIIVKDDKNAEILNCSINDKLNDIKEQFINKVKAGNIELVIIKNENIGKININCKHLERIINIFIDLAVCGFNKINKNNKKITIQTDTDNKLIFLSIIDNGPGIEEEIKKNIFKPFLYPYGKDDKNGLSLYVAYNLVKLNNGDIEISENEGGGIKFIVKFPINGI